MRLFTTFRKKLNLFNQLENSYLVVNTVFLATPIFESVRNTSVYNGAYLIYLMEKQNHDIPRLTRNDQTVLKKIIGKAKTPDLEIGTIMGLSQQAIFKIRHKLENTGIIKGYAPIIDFKKIGIEMFAMLAINFTEYAWEKYSEQQINETIQKIPEVILSYRITEATISHILVMGFQNAETKDRYLMKIQSKYAKEIEVVYIYPFSSDRIIKDNPMGLLNMVIDKKSTLSNEFFEDK